MSSKGHSRETRSGGARLKTTKTSFSQNGRKSRNPPGPVSAAATGTSDSELRNSRFHALQNTCKYCTSPCGDFNDPLAVQCTVCKAWSHKACESQDLDIVNELKMSKTFLCTECKESCKNDISAESSMESDSKYGEQDDLDIEDPDQTSVMQVIQVNSEASQRQGDSTVQITSIETSSPLPVTGENTSQLNVTKAEKVNHDSHVNTKIDQIMDLMSQVRQDVNRIDKKTRLLDAKNDAFLTSTAFKLKEQCKSSIDDAFSKLDVTKKLDKNIDQKINQGISKQMDQFVDKKIDQTLNKKLDQKVEAKLKEVTNQIDDKINNKFTLGLKGRVEEIVEERVDKVMDDFQDRLWRRKNIVIVNLPESKRSDINSRMEDDLEETLKLLNSFMRVYENQIDGFPSRIGKIGNRPRMLRVTLFSERLVKTIVGKARENSDIINPEEQDNAKRIYVNRDYSSTDRDIRKRLYAEKKDKEKRGERGWVIRKNKLIRLDNGSQFARPYSRPPHASNRNVGQRRGFTPNQSNREQEMRVSDQRRDDFGRSPLNRGSPNQLSRDQEMQVSDQRQNDDFGRSPLNRNKQNVPNYSQVVEGAVGQDFVDRPKTYSLSRSYDEYDTDRHSHREKSRYYTPKGGYNSRPTYRKEHHHRNRSRSRDRRHYSDDGEEDFGIFD